GGVHPRHLKRNSEARQGDALILGKPLGVGILSAALRKGQLTASGYQALIDTTTRHNRAGAELAPIPAVHAMTDVTGCGLLGRLRAGCGRRSPGYLRASRLCARRRDRLDERRYAHRAGRELSMPHRAVTP